MVNVSAPPSHCHTSVDIHDLWYRGKQMETKSTKREQWEQIIGAWETSGLSQKAFCQEQGHSLYLFGYWRKKTRESESDLQSADGSPRAIQLACYQIGESTSSAIDPEPELETQGIVVPIGASGLVTITGRLSIGQLAKIMAACTPVTALRPHETGAGDVPA